MILDLIFDFSGELESFFTLSTKHQKTLPSYKDGTYSKERKKPTVKCYKFFSLK